MDIHHLKVFLSVFKNKSFSKASEELYLTQPTVSSHIKAVEDELDCKLFDRVGRTIIPTKEAEVLHIHAMEIIEKLNILKDTFSQLKKDVAGDLVVGASTIPGTYLIPSIISDFHRKYPSVSFHVVVSDSKGIIEKILRHELLMGIVGAKISNSQLDFVPFKEDQLIAVSAPSFSHKTTMTFQELVKMPMILREEGSGTRREFEKILEKQDISFDKLKISGIFGSTDAVKQAVKAGLGISILSKFSVNDELRYKTLKEIKLTDIQMNRKFYILTHRKRNLPLVHSIFLDYLKANL